MVTDSQVPAEVEFSETLAAAAEATAALAAVPEVAAEPIADEPAAAPETPTPDATPAPIDWRTALKQAPRDELLQDRDLNGILGPVVQERAERLAERKSVEKARQLFESWQAQQKAEQAARQRLQEIEDLPDDDYGAKRKQEDATAIRAQMEAARLAEARAQIEAQTRDEIEVAAYDRQKRELLAGLPAEVQHDLWRRIHEPRADGSFEIASPGQLRDVVFQVKEADLRRKWEADAYPRIEREVLAKHRLTQPRPDLPSGDVPVGEPTTDQLVARFASGEINANQLSVDARRLLGIP